MPNKKEKKTAKPKDKKETVAEKKTQPRKLKGVVVSAKMQKTAVVAVSKFVQHKKYRKRYKVTKKYKAHDNEEKYAEGDKVIIVETRPVSKQKTWQVVEKY